MARVGRFGAAARALALRACAGQSTMVRELVACTAEHLGREAELGLERLRATCTHPPHRVVIVWRSPVGERIGVCHACLTVVFGGEHT